MSYIVGVDPGLKGAIAVLTLRGELLSIDDMPVAGKNVSCPIIADIFQTIWRDAIIRDGGAPICVIEDVHSMPKQGVASSFNFGRSKGVIEGCAAASEFRVEYVSPAKWKRDMKLTKDKGAARALAMDRWPQSREYFKRVKDDGRAEAALIALWQVQHGQA